MLNRRTLRIKAMQTLYALERCKQANYTLSQDFLNEYFSPDLNSMEVQDKQMLSQQKTEATKYFEHLYLNGEEQLVPSSVARAVKEATLLLENNVDKDKRHFQKLMVDEVENIHNHYLLLLALLLEMARLGRNEKEDGKNKSGEFVDNLSQNPFIKQLKHSSSFQNLATRKAMNWSSHQPEVRQWYKKIFKGDAQYLAYIALSEPNAEEHQEILKHLIKKCIFKSNTILSYMEELDMAWGENSEIIRSLLLKTVKKSFEEGEFMLQDLSYSWDEDKDFFVDLFKATYDNQDQFGELIANKSKNWDVDRVASTDRILLKLAIAEMINFPSIPIKVTINEYIEISKRYSTPKSRTFINGLLDVIAEELQANGTIRKSGRGLIDNK